MKFNLKNRPDAFASPREVDEWFEGFEKELREKLKQFPPYGQDEENAYEERARSIIEEILEV